MITEEQRYKLKKFVKELSQYKARHTELVSVYIPKDYDLNKIIQHLLQEQSTATNIKSATTRKNVIDALERMLQHLRLYKKTPAHGLAVFSGNIASSEGKTDLRVWSIEPPLPIKIRIYRCDKEFVLEPLKEMLLEKNTYGLIVIDRREATIALLNGKQIIPLVKTHSAVPGKFKAGGQSAQRFARLREGAAKEFYNKVGEYVKEQFLKRELKGIIVGGPGPTKQEFVEGNYITNEVKKKIIAIKDITYTDEFGLQELVNRSQDVLQGEEIFEEKKIMDLFFNKLAKEPGTVAYGLEYVRNYLQQGFVDTLLVSESCDEKLIEELEEEAKKFSTNLRIISTETNEGVQLKDLGGVAAILRFNVDR